MNLIFKGLLVSIFLLGTGCFTDVSVEECLVDGDCPAGRPACIDGACFLQSARSAVEPCTSSSESGDQCCLYEQGSGTPSDGCFRFVAVHSGTVSTPAFDPALERFVYATGSPDSDTSLVARSLDGVLQWRTVLDDDCRGIVNTPVLSPSGQLLYACKTGVVRVSADGDVLDEGVVEIPGGPVGAPAIFSPELMAVAASASLNILRQQGVVSSILLDIGELPPALGPFFLKNGSKILVPTHDGAQLALVQVQEEAVLWESGPLETDTRVIGVAPDLDNGILVVTGRGRLHRLDASTGRAGDYWFTPSTRELLAAGGPWLLPDGAAMYLTVDGRLNRVDFENHHDPLPVLMDVPTGLPLFPLRGGGLLICAAEGLRMRLPGRLGVPEDGPAFWQTWALSEGCSGLSALARDGTLAVVSGHSVIGLAIPTPPASEPWPEPRGIGHSGRMD